MKLKQWLNDSRFHPRIKNYMLLIIAIVLVGGLLGVMWRSNRVEESSVVSDTEIVEQEVVPETVEETPIEKTEEQVEEKPPAPAPEPPASQWPVVYSMEQAASLTVVVNKKHKLPQEYVPALRSVAGGQMRPEAADALEKMLQDADAAGVPMRIISSYRSYATQVSTYQKWVNIQGQAEADRSSARPGHSEHQTGLAVDLGMPDGSCDLLICFGDTAQGKWLAANAPAYGFIVRYQTDTESVTGYHYEPWHMRYLGIETAQAVSASGKTLDQYYGVEAGGY